MARQQNQFFRYIISGGTATVFNLLTVFFMRLFTYYEIAVVVGALVGTGTTYLLTKVFVFNANGKAVDRNEIMRFLFVHALVCTQIWLVSVSLDWWVLPMYWSPDIRQSISSVIGVSSVVLTGFFLHRKITYREP